MNDEIERLRHKFTTQYPSRLDDWSYAWHPLNPVSIYYRQAQERAITGLFRDIKLDISKLKVLDIGCGNGRFLRFLAELGASPDLLYGIDLVDDRIRLARLLAAGGMTLQVGNAECLPWPDHSFDLVSQFTVFSSILDAELRRRLAVEITRVLKPGGHLLWYDMQRTSNASLHGLFNSDIRQLFPGMLICYRQSLHPIRAAQVLRYGRLLSTIWEYIPGIPRSHNLVLLQNP